MFCYVVGGSYLIVDELDQLNGLLHSRDVLQEQSRQSTPEERVIIRREILWVMARVAALLDRIKWEQVLPAA